MDVSTKIILYMCIINYDNVLAILLPQSRLHWNIELKLLIDQSIFNCFRFLSEDAKKLQFLKFDYFAVMNNFLRFLTIFDGPYLN